MVAPESIGIERNLPALVQEHFDNAPLMWRRPSGIWPQDAYFKVATTDELEPLYDIANDILRKEGANIRIPQDTAEHEQQHIDAISQIVVTGDKSIDIAAGLAVVRHPIPLRKILGRFTVLAYVVPLQPPLSVIEHAAIVAHPDQPSPTDIHQLQKLGYDSLEAAGQAIVSHNARNPTFPLPIPRWF